MKKGFIGAGLLAILSFATPAFAQPYYGSNSYGSAYYPQQAYANPLIHQTVTIPSYNYAPISIPNFNMPYSVHMPQQQYYASQQQNNYQYQNATQPNFYYTYPPVNQVRYNPAPMHYVPTTPARSYPEYDPYYSQYSNYYTTYPQQNMGFTGDRDALGTPLCNWQGYGRSDCSFNPHQWVYDPYTGTWY